MLGVPILSSVTRIFVILKVNNVSPGTKEKFLGNVSMDLKVKALNAWRPEDLLNSPTE